mgnify:CR=1 FL=1
MLVGIRLARFDVLYLARDAEKLNRFYKGMVAGFWKPAGCYHRFFLFLIKMGVYPNTEGTETARNSAPYDENKPKQLNSGA